MYDSVVEGNVAVIAVAISMSVILGILITLLVRKFLRQWLICIIGAVVCVLISMAIMKSIAPPVWVSYLVYIISGVIGFLVFKNAKSFLIKLSTAFIGSFMFVLGLSIVIDRYT